MRAAFLSNIACAAAFFAAAAIFAAGAAPADVSVMTVADLRASPPVGKIVRVSGYVTGTYLCPPCPAGMTCKPCMSESNVYISDAPGDPAIAIAVPEPAQFERGKRYRFEITVIARAPEGVDGRLLRSQPANDPEWPAP